MTAERPPVVLIHGWSGSTRTTWGPLDWPGALTKAGRRVIGVDLLGHGDAPAPHEPSAYADLAANASDAFTHEPVVDAIAYSLGAKVLLELVAQSPDRFGRIVLAGLGENAFRQEGGKHAVREALSYGITDATPAPLRPYLVHAFASGNDLLALAACFERPWTPMEPARLSRYTGAALVAVGDDDTFAGSIAPMCEALAGAVSVRLPGVDHLATPYSRLLLERALAFLAA